MKSLLEYIINPVSFEKPERFTIKIFLNTIGLSYLLFYLLSVFLIPFTLSGLLTDYKNPIVNSAILFFIVVIFMPLIEEIFFRLNLRISKVNIAAFFSVLIIVIVKILFFSEIQFYIYLGTIPIFGLIYLILKYFYSPISKIEIFWKSNFTYIFHFFAFFFGMMHLTNYETIYWWMIIISPLLTVPYIGLGYVLGYIRMKYGFKYSWLIHSTLNFIFVILTIHKGIVIVLIITFIVLITNSLFEKVKKQNSIKILR